MAAGFHAQAPNSFRKLAGLGFSILGSSSAVCAVRPPYLLLLLPSRAVTTTLAAVTGNALQFGQQDSTSAIAAGGSTAGTNEAFEVVTLSPTCGGDHRTQDLQVPTRRQHLTTNPKNKAAATGRLSKRRSRSSSSSLRASQFLNTTDYATMPGPSCPFLVLFGLSPACLLLC